MIQRPHYWLDIIILVLALMAAFALSRFARQAGRRAQFPLLAAIGLAASISTVGAMFVTVRVARLFPSELVTWVRCVALFVSAGLVYAAILIAAVKRMPAYSPGRRRLLQLSVSAAVAAPVGLTTFGILRRDNLSVREVDVPLPREAAGLNGLRIVQVTDIHLSTFVPESYLARAVDMANECRPHLALVTGDLISTKGDPLDACLRQLARLRADAGIYGCCGNHEIYAEAEEYVKKQGARFGMQYLRQESVPLRFGNARIQLAGVDYQRKGEPYLPGAELLQEAGSYNMLLTHSPDVFPVAADQGWDFCVAGHTHGGQVQLEFLHPSLNVARFYTPYIYGLYERDGKRIYVSRGVGTIGVPLRLGAPPEVVCLRLCAT